MRKIGLITLIVLIALSFGITANANEKKSEGAGDITFGGHMRMWMFDNVSGDSTYSGKTTSNTQVIGPEFSSHAFMFFISKNITENLSVMGAPDWSLGSASATPSLGQDIGRRRSNYDQDPSLKWNQLWVKYNIPQYQLEARFGYMNVQHTWEYGQELFWHDQLAGTKFVCDGDLAAWHDTGLELYRGFEVSNISLPVWLYILNGMGSTDYMDNNSNKTIMVHTEPDFSAMVPGLRTLVSYGFGNWGTEDWEYDEGPPPTYTRMPASLKNEKYYRYAIGAQYDFGQFNLPVNVRFEAAGMLKENGFNTGTANEEDAGKSGYYLKVFYRVIPDKLTAMLGYDYARKEVNATKHEEYKTTLLGLQYELAPAATVILDVQMYDWENDLTGNSYQALDVNRVGIGMRITF